MEPRTFLRLEGLAVGAVAVGWYFAADGPVWMLLVLALVPDLSMAGYLAGPRIGSLSYNVVHTYVFSLGLGVGSLWADWRLGLLLALVWTAHIGIDRLFGYGLKFDTGFSETHLSSQPAPVDTLTEIE